MRRGRNCATKAGYRVAAYEAFQAPSHGGNQGNSRGCGGSAQQGACPSGPRTMARAVFQSPLISQPAVTRRRAAMSSASVDARMSLCRAAIPLWSRCLSQPAAALQCSLPQPAAALQCSLPQPACCPKVLTGCRVRGICNAAAGIDVSLPSPWMGGWPGLKEGLQLTLTLNRYDPD